MMVIDNKFDIGQTVYIKTDDEQKQRIVTSIIVCPNGLIYECFCSTLESKHYDFELSSERNILTAIG